MKGKSIFHVVETRPHNYIHYLIDAGSPRAKKPAGAWSKGFNWSKGAPACRSMKRSLNPGALIACPLRHLPDAVPLPALQGTVIAFLYST